jgi:tetratricopeptide (TPR) repeat protein
MRPERRSVPGLADEIADLRAELDDDRSPRNVMRTAEAFWLLGRPESALELLRPLVREAPALVAPRILAAWCAEDAGHPEEARARLKEAAEIDPANPYAAHRVPAAAVAGPVPSAGPERASDDELQAERERAPDDELQAEPERAPDDELQAEPERALDAAQLREVPPSPLYSATLAEIFAKQGFQEKAIEIYRRLASQDPGRSDLASRIRALEEQAGGTEP